MIIQLSQNYNLGGDAKVVIPSGTQMEVSQDLAFTLAREGVATIVSYTPETGGLQKPQLIDANGKPTSPPDFWDVTTSTTVVYLGWKSGSIIILSKTDLSAGTRTWGTDTWANRVTATYA